MLTGHGIQVWVFSGQDWLIRDRDGPYVELEERTIAFAPTVVRDFGSALMPPRRSSGSARMSMVLRIARETWGRAGDRAFVVRSQPYYLDVTHPSANKGAALTEVAKF